MKSIDSIECDIAVIGGGFGGVAAALAACENGASVVITEESDWLGGQVTSQLVAPLDEHEYIERFGGTRSYYQFRNKVRAYYEKKYGLKINNPGGGWVSELCFEPAVGLEIIHDLLEPYLSGGKLKIYYLFTPTQATMIENRISSITCIAPGDKKLVIRAQYYLDATELGDLLELVEAPYSTGAEAIEETGEPNASKDGPHPHQVQSFTCCFILEKCPGQNHTIRKPRNYEFWRNSQPFSLDIPSEPGSTPIHYPLFTPIVQDQLTFWTYRRILNASAFPRDRVANDLSLINWDSNDFRGGDLIGASQSEKVHLLSEAKSLSASFLYYLQTEVPRDDGKGFGYSELRLVPEAAGTLDGFGKRPYIRESRRLLGMRRIVENDICENKTRNSARAQHFHDSIGIGFYPIDIHNCCNGPLPEYHFSRSLPFQIPLGALFCEKITNLIASAKNISTTHITNGAYRLHPVEWNIGESAAALATFCLREHLSPDVVCSNELFLRHFQQTLLQRGIPLSWELEVGANEKDFVAIQTCMTIAPFKSGKRAHSLLLHPEEPITRGELHTLLVCLPGISLNSVPLEEIDSSATSSWIKRLFKQANLPISDLSEDVSYLHIVKLLSPYLTNQ